MIPIGDLIEKGLDLLYPPALYCCCCGNMIDESRTYHLCDHCMEHIRWDRQSPREIEGMKVLRCVQYGLYERTMIFSLKYNGKKYIGRVIGQIMADRLALAKIDFDVILPVPMHAGKEKRRGFNQAALIGQYLGKIVDKPSIGHGLIRVEETRPMRGLSPTERIENVKGKFSLNPKCVTMIEKKRVLLIDDFYTTGSTARECCSVLQKADPEEVIFLAFAAK